jgi:uncharacterized protein YukE
MASASAFIKFDPDKIAEIAASLALNKQLFDQYAKGIIMESRLLERVWQGDTADLYQKKINELEKRNEEIIKGFSKFDQDLQAASGIYRTGEADAKQTAEALPTDMFS